MRAQINPSTIAVRMYTLLVGLALGLGGVILLGGHDRFAGESFHGARMLVEWVPVAPPWVLWGSLFIAYGLSLAWSMGRDIGVHALRFGVVVYMFLVISFLESLFPEPTAALTAVVAYTTFALIHGVLSVHVEKYGWSC